MITRKEIIEDLIDWKAGKMGFNALMDAIDRYALQDKEKVASKNFIQSDVMLSLPSDRKKHMRKQANTVFELTKGFTTQTNDNAMKTALEMAAYVQELTTDVE